LLSLPSLSIACSCFPREVRSTEAIAKEFARVQLVAEVEVVDVLVNVKGDRTIILEMFGIRKGNLEVGDRISLHEISESLSSCNLSMSFGARVLYFGEQLSHGGWSIPHVCSPSGDLSWYSPGQRKVIEELSRDGV
jgi:hypothetical protein